ncbi:piggyBac transposable element-derived protein 4-like [Bombus vosnesenskii]|uniref:PiggyBac transposable element-derived protein 4-like n=1 Tax=Bombus vosnesenskii TaxID=207650 RepID=A0A6J3L824_9HYME|nr:piggyBac transposable element-derived protein 4-like [Bombus vosnesenskii]
MDMEISDSSDESIIGSRRIIQRAHIHSSSSDEASNDSESSANELTDDTMEEEDFESDSEEEDLDEEWQEIRERGQTMTEYSQEEELLIEDTDCDDPVSLYKLFFTDNILEMIVEETNKYAVQCLENSVSNSREHQLDWKPVTKDEMNTFIGILLIMGLVPLPKIRLY